MVLQNEHAMFKTALPLQVRPRRDPWQQKVIVHLQEKQPMDELLKMHSRFLQVSVTSCRLFCTQTVKSASRWPAWHSLQDPDLQRVAAVMKEHTAFVAEPQPSPGINALPHGTKEIWRRVYGVTPPSVSFIFWFKRRKPNSKTFLMKVDICPIRELDKDLVGGAWRIQPQARAMRGDVTRQWQFELCLLWKISLRAYLMCCTRTAGL